MLVLHCNLLEEQNCCLFQDSQEHSGVYFRLSDFYFYVDKLKSRVAGIICSLERCEPAPREEPPMCWKLETKWVKLKFWPTLVELIITGTQNLLALLLKLLRMRFPSGTWIHPGSWWHFSCLDPSRAVVEISKQPGWKGEGRFSKSLPSLIPAITALARRVVKGFSAHWAVLSWKMWPLAWRSKWELGNVTLVAGRISQWQKGNHSSSSPLASSFLQQYQLWKL